MVESAERQNPTTKRRRRTTRKVQMNKATKMSDLRRSNRGLQNGHCFRCGIPTRHAMFKGTFACSRHEPDLVRGRVAAEATYDIHDEWGPEDAAELPDSHKDIRMYRSPRYRKPRPSPYDYEGPPLFGGHL